MYVCTRAHEGQRLERAVNMIIGGSVLAGEKKGSGSHSEERRGGGMFTGAREKATEVAYTPSAPGLRENTKTIAKQKQLPSAGLDTCSMHGSHAQKTTSLAIYSNNQLLYHDPMPLMSSTKF